MARIGIKADIEAVPVTAGVTNVDTTGYGTVTIIASCTGAGAMTVKAGDDVGHMALVDAKDLIGSLTTANGGNVVSYIGDKKFVQVATLTGGTATAVVVLGEKLVAQ